MMNHEYLRFLDGRFWAVFILSILLLALGLTGVAAQEPALPQTPPDAEAGLAIFVERCANCHGPTGGGDGELAADLPKPPAVLSDPEFRKTAVPATLFGRITNGIIDAGMPPFGSTSSNPIAEENRWDLIAAVYSFSTPADSLTLGQTVYEENCLACHGESGLGDGPDAAADANLDLTELSYWFNRSNETVLADVNNSAIPEHAFDLSEDEQWAVVDYARTFSYGYFDALAPLEPIETAVISGQITNGTTGEILIGGEAMLRAFNASFQETLTLTTTVGVDGRYQFDLAAVQPDWVYLTGIRYKELSFSSDAGQINRADPALDLPITVYETTTDPAAITIEQVHLIMGFEGDSLQVSELYVVSNRGTAVFVGATGDSSQGTIQFNLPAGAQAPVFERTLGSMESTIPATEIIQTATGWADTLPVQPGPGGLNLIVSYLLPFEDGMSLNRILPYTTNNANVILPEVGVTVAGSDWLFQGAQQMSDGGSSFLSYTRAGLQSGEELTLTLEGKPDAAATVGGSAVAPRNTTNELLIGGGILLIAIAAAILFFRNAQAKPYLAEEYDYYDEDDGGDVEIDETTQLIRAIADLDNAHERGELDEADYTSQREKLKSELKTLWK